MEKVQSTIKSVIEQVKKEGFDPKRIEAAIHQMELSQKHVSLKVDYIKSTITYHFMQKYRKLLILVLQLCMVSHLVGLMVQILLIF